ncbi:universal stress protein [Szabonella alba]|uniref:Universal stress protein n=1 Tax=Szabonella alba TaxID=2804194 RepID=A0A8K0VAW5_9RHOB|nr:universal stress protein [Szabonella alba]MBL4918849.1 universal stress protein [Szabonella alba]
MTGKIIVAVDGSEAGARAMAHAHARAKGLGASLLVVHVLEWSPYTFLTPEELEERHARRKQELARAEEAIISPLITRYDGQGVGLESAIRYGHVVETICDIAEKQGAIEIVTGRTGNSGMMSRVFGSVAGTLAQVAPVPCTIVP